MQSGWSFCFHRLFSLGHFYAGLLLLYTLNVRVTKVTVPYFIFDLRDQSLGYWSYHFSDSHLWASAGYDYVTCSTVE